jgi:hypothetical protein
LQQYYHARSLGLGSAAWWYLTLSLCSVVGRGGGRGESLFMYKGTSAGIEDLPLSKWIIWIPAPLKRMFRVDRYTFEEILEKISPFLDEKNDQKAINSSGSPVTNKTQLAVTLRW